MGSTPFPEIVRDVASKLYQVADTNACGALSVVAQSGIHDRTSAMYIAAMSAAPALRFIASLIVNVKDDENKSNKACKETALIAGLILGRMIQPEGDNVQVDFTPRNVLAAIEAASKVAGYDVKPFVDIRMLESYQEGLVDDSKNTLGYWDFIPDVGQTVDFSDLGSSIVGLNNFSKTRH